MQDPQRSANVAFVTEHLSPQPGKRNDTGSIPSWGAGPLRGTPGPVRAQEAASTSKHKLSPRQHPQPTPERNSGQGAKDLSSTSEHKLKDELPVTYPQQPQPGYPAPPYAQPQPGYAQQPQQPYAPQPGYPAPGEGYAYPPAPPNPYAPQPGYPPQPAPQGYGQPYAPPVPPQPDLPPPTVKDFFEQPASAGGKALSFNVIGTRYTGTVVRDVTDADMERATELGVRPGMQGGFAKHPDGRDKINMKVPVLLDQPTPEYPTGIAVWYVKGNERSELLRAMQMAGAEPGPPRGGDRIDITYTHDEPSRSGFSPRKVKHIVYTAGNGVLPQMPQAPVQGQQPPGPVQQPQFTPPGYGMPQPGYQQYAPQPQMQTAPPAPPQPQFQQPQYPVPQEQYAQQMPPYANGQAAQHYAAQGYQAAPGQEQYLNPAQLQAQQQFQQAPPTSPGAPQGAPNGSMNGAQPMAPASPSSPGGPPADWPADVPFIPGLKPDQARIAALHHLGQQPQQ